MARLFDEGGPYDIQRTGGDEYSMSIPLPKDDSGRVARQCPKVECSPGYFKVRPGTGVTGVDSTTFCPYCRHASDSAEYHTQEQVQFAKDSMMAEAHKGLGKMFQDAFGLGPSGRKRYGGDLFSLELTYNPSRPPIVRRPFEEEIQRDIICPHCGLDHAVFGLATWCSDCGRDIFLTHVSAEYHVVEIMLEDVVRRREEFGPRVAARDIDNALEDVVSIYEATLKAMIARRLRVNGYSDEEAQTVGLGGLVQLKRDNRTRHRNTNNKHRRT